ncbi:glycosyltransferase [Devosia geojensis]|uniref:Glycosyltransferase n=1 Tax=Devosia geojensis TaxID=443610 RepID=A0A0F5FWF5_9HYPH|nr:glycosyltransferase family 2 protein [Devosia geojensis]KKB12910.1 glycosyltransferase [Devosia geojensis]
MSDYALDLVVPCYNEEDVLPQTVPVMLTHLRSLAADPELNLNRFRILLVNDGSVDGTWPVIEALARENPEVVGVRLSRNFGHQNALLAGLHEVTADVCVSMDCDLQDDIGVIKSMLLVYQRGTDLALGVRNDRSSDSSGKRRTANAYYRLLSLMGVRIIENHADFRMMSRRALAALLEHSEVNLFLRGLIPTLGFSVTLIPYKRMSRTLGETKYTLRKMIRLAIDGVTSFSIAPLRAVAILGTCVFALSTGAGLYFLMERLLNPQSVTPGWASTVLPLLFLGGVQILSIGVLGEYIGKIYMEVKRRPRFIIQERTKDG